MPVSDDEIDIVGGRDSSDDALVPADCSDLFPDVFNLPSPVPNPSKRNRSQISSRRRGSSKRSRDNRKMIVSTLYNELPVLKETIANQEAQIAALKAEVEQLKRSEEESKARIEVLQRSNADLGRVGGYQDHLLKQTQRCLHSAVDVISNFNDKLKKTDRWSSPDSPLPRRSGAGFFSEAAEPAPHCEEQGNPRSAP